MKAMRIIGFTSVGAIALATSSAASAASYLFDFQFDALNVGQVSFAASNIVYSADSLDPSTLAYVSGDVNGAASPIFNLVFSFGVSERAWGFGTPDFSVPPFTVADVIFQVQGPFAAGQTYETRTAARAVSAGGAFGYYNSTGRLTISELPTAVPEPATWAMLILGFGFVGGALRAAKRTRRITVSYA